jgi:hypothetical protein
LAGHYILANLSRHGLRHYLRFHFRRALSPADACLTEATGPKGSDARCAFPIIANHPSPNFRSFPIDAPFVASAAGDLHVERSAALLRVHPRPAHRENSVVRPSSWNTHRWFSRRSRPASLRRELWIRAKFFMRPNLGYRRQSARSRQWQRMPSPARIHATRR